MVMEYNKMKSKLAIKMLNLSYGVIGKDILVPTLFDYVIIFSHSHKVENHKCILIQSPNARHIYQLLFFQLTTHSQSK